MYQGPPTSRLQLRVSPVSSQHSSDHPPQLTCLPLEPKKRDDYFMHHARLLAMRIVKEWPLSSAKDARDYQCYICNAYIAWERLWLPLLTRYEALSHSDASHPTKKRKVGTTSNVLEHVVSMLNSLPCVPAALIIVF